MRRAPAALVVALTAALAVLAPAGAAADDEIEIDERLLEMGYDDAYTGYLYAEVDGREGVRVSVDYASDSEDAQAYEQQAQEVAGVVWRHLELRVLAVDVTPTYGVSWLDGQLPPAISLTATELRRIHGPRPEELDDGGPGAYGSDEDLVAAAAAFGLVALLVVAVLVAAGGVGGFLLGRRSGRRSGQPDAWGVAPTAWSGGGWAPPPSGWAPSGPPPSGWAQPPPQSSGTQQPPDAGWPQPPDAAAPAAPPPDPSNPWRTP